MIDADKIITAMMLRTREESVPYGSEYIFPGQQ